MLFNSYSFLFYFLPCIVFFYYLTSRLSGSRSSNFVLVIGSFVFYCCGGFCGGSVFIVCSIVFNFITSYYLGYELRVSRKLIFVIGVIVNLCPLFFLKYSSFFAQQVNAICAILNLGFVFSCKSRSLPPGISFLTFQQIAFLHSRYVKSGNFRGFFSYASSVVFFPHLIAGPLVDYNELISQFQRPKKLSSLGKNVIPAFFVFLIGLSKKLLIADSLEPTASALFDSTLEQIGALPCVYIVAGCLAYTLQLYFDFSGYSDMAIGLALVFGIRLPQNFNSPYKSSSLVDFWRHWHITLSVFLRNFIYIPLGGARNGTIRKLLNLCITMLVCGIWHGAGWTYIAWGLWHALGLCINHLWRSFCFSGRFWGFFLVPSWILTFSFVSIGWIFFRADSISKATEIIFQIFSRRPEGLEGLMSVLIRDRFPFVFLGITLFIVILFPNSDQIARFIKLETSKFFRSSSYPTSRVAMIVLVASLFFSLCLIRIARPQIFIYYQF
jgi:alginate O-acetyltransferase complex protein AlgI